jgi:integrase
LSVGGVFDGFEWAMPGDTVRGKLGRERSLKLKVPRQIGKAYTPDEKQEMLKAAKAARSPSIYPALMLALNAGMRDAEIKTLQWERVDLMKAFLVVGDSKSDAGEGRTIPLNSALLQALVEHAKWYTKRFGIIQPDWYLFPWGKPTPSDPTRPIGTLKKSWANVRTKAGVSGRWHDNRHTMITDLAEQGAPDEVIRDIAGHVSKQMLKHYSHVRRRSSLVEAHIRSMPLCADWRLATYWITWQSAPSAQPRHPRLQNVQIERYTDAQQACPTESRRRWCIGLP